MVKRIVSKMSGFTLLEVMIALAIFAVYATAIIQSNSATIFQSARLGEDLNLHNLAELKVNEVLVSDKKFTTATENDVESGEFEIEGLENYKYKIEFKKLELPEFEAVMGKTEEESQDVDVMQKTVYTKMKKNIEKIIWQFTVTVTNSISGEEYTLSSWIRNKKAQIDTSFGL